MELVLQHFPEEGQMAIRAVMGSLMRKMPRDSDDEVGFRELQRDDRLPKRDYVLEYPMSIASYEYDVDKMKMFDTVWGECEIGQEPYDGLLLELAKTPLFRRLQAVEQLTFSGDFSTLPNTSGFSRWQHIWGSLAFVRKMTDGDERFSERDRIVMQLRTLFSDVGQTSLSHLGDWLWQGLQGGEDQHDQDLRELLETSGIEEMLTRYGLTLDETVFPNVKDWVECPSPALCVDRVDYGLREILRWACPPSHVNMYMKELHDPKQLFEINTNGELVIKNLKFAREFALGFSLLPSDDWSHPTHRVMMELMQTSIRDALMRKVKYSGIHPRELMYGIDFDFDDYFVKWGGAEIGDIMKQIALEQRRIFTVARHGDLEAVFSGMYHDDAPFPNFPDPLKSYTWRTKTFGKYPLPSQLSVKEKGISDPYMKATKKGLQIGLPRLKPRRIDPVVKTENGYEPLSQIDSSYAQYLDQQDALMARSFKATVHMRKDVAKILVDKHEKALRNWERASKRARNPEFLKKVIAGTAFTLSGAVHRFDNHTMSDAFRDEIDLQRAGGIGAWTDVQGLLND